MLSCVLGGADGPVDRFRGRYERRAEKHEHAQVDAVVRQKPRRVVEALEIEALVEPILAQEQKLAK